MKLGARILRVFDIRDVKQDNCEKNYQHNGVSNFDLYISRLDRIQGVIKIQEVRM